MALNINGFLSKLFGNKAARDMREIKPIVDQILAIYPEIQKLTKR